MEEFDRLIGIVKTLRSPNGCPWDREQTLESIVENIIEEAYEVVQAITEGDYEKIKEETGDLILQGVFISQIAKEMGKFSIDEVLKDLNSKLLQRHPHVFGNEALPESTEESLKLWETKKKESNNILEEIPKNFPTLLYIYKVIQKSKRKGLLRFSETQLISEISSLLLHDDILRDTEKLEDLIVFLLALLSYRNVRTEVNLREKFLKISKKWIQDCKFK
ncbi:MAG: MazG nucleotide pyrophosphohydrolase domain-containing protein [Brevinematia bacterium]